MFGFKQDNPRALPPITQLAALASAENQEQSAASSSSVAEALGELLEFVSNPDNLWVVTRDMLAVVASHIRAPGCVRAVTIWKNVPFSFSSERL